MKTQQPKKPTYSQIILNYMLAGNCLSTCEAFNLWQITCFLQRISDLRDQGIIIQDEWVKNNGKRFKRYWIDHPVDTTNDAKEVQS